MAGSTYALLLAVEQYQQDGLPAVPFATADAYSMRDILIQQLNVPPANIKLWVDQEVTQNRLKQEIPYDIRGLQADDRYILFYAGELLEVRNDIRSALGQVNAMIEYFELAAKPVDEAGAPSHAVIQ